MYILLSNYCDQKKLKRNTTIHNKTIHQAKQTNGSVNYPVCIGKQGETNSPRTITRGSVVVYGCIMGKLEGSMAFCIVGCESMRRSWFCGLGGLLLLETSKEVRVCDLAKLTCFVFGAWAVGGGGAGCSTGRGPSNFIDSSSSGSHVYLKQREVPKGLTIVKQIVHTYMYADEFIFLFIFIVLVLGSVESKKISFS